MSLILINAALAVIPSILVLFYLRGIADALPARTLYAIFATGYFAVVPALVAELFIAPLLRTDRSAIDALVRAFLTTAFVEESAKLLVLTTWRRNVEKSRRGIVVAAVTAGLGFAAFENVAYSTGTTAIILLRGITAVPLHVAASLCIGCAFARYRRGPGVLAGLAVAIVVHGTYDALLFLGGAFSILVLPYVLLLVSVVFYFARKDVHLRPRRED